MTFAGSGAARKPKLDDKALTLAVGAAIRHRHTNYDELLISGVDREAARSRVYDVLHRWREG